MLLYLSLMALTSLPIWRDEKLLFLRERDSGAYGTPAYFAAVVLFDLLPMRIIPPTFFALFSYWMIGLHKSSAVCLLWFIGAFGVETMESMVVGVVASYVWQITRGDESLFAPMLGRTGIRYTWALQSSKTISSFNLMPQRFCHDKQSLQVDT